MIAITTALKKISKMKGKLRIIQGGARAGKTFSIMLLLVNYAIATPGKRIAVFGITYSNIERGVLIDFEQIITEAGYWDFIEKKRYKYTFTNATTIEFISADNYIKILSTQFDVSFVNEVRFVNFDFFNQVKLRTKEVLLADFNPVTKFYIHDFINNNNVSFIKLTYKDNEMCPQGIIEELEGFKELAKTNSYWANYVKVFVEGEVGGVIDVVYPDWQYIHELPPEAKLIACGVDFGFTNDVTAIIALYYNDNIYYIDELTYDKGLKTNEIANMLKPYRHVPIFCDNAEPRLISELKEIITTKNLIGVKFKILESIAIVQQQQVRVVYSANNIINEHQSYVFLRDKISGNLTNIPIGTNNHAMDAIRYAINGLKEFKIVKYQTKFI